MSGGIGDAQTSSEAPATNRVPGSGSQPPAVGRPRGNYLLGLSLATLGVVYGDIGTSPIYALRECFHGEYAIALMRENLLGVLSLIFWSLILVISTKYLGFILRADNRGEGGILALMALVHPERSRANGHRGRNRKILVGLGLFGAALLYGDGMITPAISVLSAVEGVEVATPVFKPFIIPVTCLLLIGLFLFQRRGTGGVGAVFGPVTLLWFITLGALGVRAIIGAPEVLGALSPHFAVGFLAANGQVGFLVLGAVFLVVTGGEALYADMGHFGARPIRFTWFCVALPGLLLNYFGQGALLLRSPGAVDHPFYRMVPEWGLYPLVILTTAATIIASQAVISGTFSLTMQAVQLGYSPRMEIRHTSSREIGQIYLPAANWMLMLACIALVVGFRSSSHLAAAYGVAVTTTMVITTLLFYVVCRERWGWGRPAAIGLTVLFLVFDLAFFGASMLKISHGGWLPLVVAAAAFTLMSTWRRGRAILRSRLDERTIPLSSLLARVDATSPVRVPGAAFYMTGDPQRIPPALVENLRHNKVLHERVALLSVVVEDVPYVPTGRWATAEEMGQGFHRMILRYGFMERPNVPFGLERITRETGLDFSPAHSTFFLGRETLISGARPGMALWRARLFALMSRNAQRPAAFFQLPADRVVEIGILLEL